ncbi:MAG: TetR/AcrR family transcriptional regulator [Actinomycetota bacterium]|nr:TetR/AcrR family transcriptional regulator [Actinomycetota bacterium]
MSIPQALPLEVPVRRKRNPRGSLNKEVILAEAFRLCRQENLDELSMPKLAKRLGVGVTSLYWYFHTKEELLQTMLAQVADEFLQALPDHSGLAWDEHFRRYFTDMRRIFLANDVISDFLVMYTHVSMITPGGYFMARLNSEVGILMDTGLSPQDATRGYQAMSTYTTGTVQKIRQVRLRGENPNLKMFPIDDLAMMSVIGTEYPNLGITSEYWHRTYSTDVDYEFGLNLIIDGLRALIP